MDALWDEGEFGSGTGYKKRVLGLRNADSNIFGTFGILNSWDKF